jgi:hypothetical protein
MKTLHLAETAPPVRQALATGRFTETITGRAIEGFTATLGYTHAGGVGTFPTTLATKPGGYFALHLHPDRDVPDLSGAGTVTLTLRLARPGAADAVAVRQVPGTELAPTEVTRQVAGQQVTIRRVAAAPFVFSVAVPPAPVLLDGLLLWDGDPAEPADGVTVTAAPAAAVVTDARGRFRIPQLPVEEEVSLTFDDSDQVIARTLRPDYSRPVMDVAFAIPSA